jgi:carboxymethylenebutenolidase
MPEMTTLANLPGYLVRPPAPGPHPALFVIQEWWGLDAQTKSIAERFAAEGYLVFSPDVYHGELAELGDNEKAMSLLQKYSPNAPAELAEAYNALKAHPDCNGKIGSVGFCFGGRMSLHLAMLRPLDAACTFYGGGMQTIFDQMREKLRCPVLGLFGDADVSIPVGTVEQFDLLLDDLGLEHQVIVYPNSGHAFFRDSDPKAYIPEASADAWERVKAFFAKHLR